MTIAIDIDQTWTLDPEFWQSFAGYAESVSHRVVIITGRSQPAEKLYNLGLSQATVLTCNPGEFKADCAARHGIKVDVWIDDMPGTIEPQRKLQPLTDTDQL